MPAGGRNLTAICRSAAQQDAVKSAVDDVKEAYEDLPGDTTGAEALTELTPDLQRPDGAVTDAQSGLRRG